MPVFGTVTLWSALVASIGSVSLYLAANAKRSDAPLAAKLTRVGRGLFALATLCILAAAATLGALLVTHRFDVQYVFEHSARAMAPLYWFPSFWAGQEGSFLLWAFWTAILGTVLAATSGSAERRVMPIYGVVLVFLAILLVIRSPFGPTLDQFGLPSTPTEGLGLNPNLENPWMVIHPPTMFLGFASLAVPFAFALSALFWKDWDGWLRRALPWGLFGFAILGLAMMMGGYWAYEMLGWGGFWAWDPVENGPFIPWMGLVAFLHAAQIQRVRGGFMKPTLFFATLPLLGGMFKSFMTRSGALSDFSVHSFSQLGGISNALLLGALLVVVLFSLVTLFRRPGGDAPGGGGTSERGDRPSVWEAPTSREYGFTIALVLLTLCAVIAAVGMSAPALTGLGVKLHLAKYSASVSEDYHNRAMFPMAVLLAIGLGIGPHLAWRGRGAPDGRRLVTAYAVSVLAALGFIVLTRWVGTGLTGAKLIPQLLLFTAAVFALVSSVFMLRQLFPSGGPVSEGGVTAGLRGAGSRVWTVGGALSHLGIAVILLGIVCLVTFVRKDSDVQLIQGTAKSVLDGQYKITYRGQTSDWQTDRNNALLFDVASRDGREKFTARMPFALRAIEGGDKKIIGHPAITHHAGGDLYLALKDGPDYIYSRGRYVQKIKLGDTKTFGPYAIQFVKFERDPKAAAFVQQFQQMPDVFPMWAVLRVTYQGQTTLLRPQYVMRRDNPMLPQTPEVKLPGGWLVSFNDTPDAINAGSADPNNPSAGAANEGSQFVLRPAGPVLEAFQLEVTTRPMINLVWLGTLLLVFGGLISMGRRIRENRAIPVPDLPDVLPAPKAGARRHSGRRRTAPGAKPAPSLAAAQRSTRKV